MKKNQQGFTLIELLIVVAIIGIIAAIAIPSLLRARVSANEAGTIGDIRAISSAESAYASVSGGAYGALTCLSVPSGCISAYPAAAPTFIDSAMAGGTARSGYDRNLFPGGAITAATLIGTGNYDGFIYAATPTTLNQTGVRGFAGDASGRICYTNGGAVPATSGAILNQTCDVIK